MKIRNMITCAFLACILFSIPAVAQEEAEAPTMTPEQQAEMMAWMELAAPGPHHEHMAPFVGTWKGKVQMWMGPEAPEMTEESTAEVAWIMGGRFLEWRQTGEFGGMPYESRAIEGYNNGDKRYESMWMDNFGTLMVFYTGQCSDDGKTRVIEGSFTNPMDGSVIEQKNVYTWIDDDHFQVETFMKMGDEEYKQMEMLYQRQ